MVSLWGSKDGEEHAEGEEGGHNGEDTGQSTRHSARQDPDERTRLLPPRHDGYLDPDDPAVRLVNFILVLLNTINSEPFRYRHITYGALELSDT